MPLLEIKHLSTEFVTEQGIVQAVRDVSLTVEQGEVLGVVGESGSGKSQTMFSLMGLLADNGRVTSGSIIFDGQDISRSNFKTKKEYEKVLQGLRGNSVSMIFQDPMTFLNQIMRIEDQMVEPMLNHTKMTRKEARERALDLMRKVGIASPEKRIRQYPFEFSGGMRQRIIIAIALANNPKLIIADEPTTALDVTIQAQVLELIDSLREDSSSAIIMITHNLGVVAKLCDRVAIMYGGKIVEIGTDEEIFYEPNHPYTIGLLSCIAHPEEENNQQIKPIPGSPPDLMNPPKGCPFVDRCERAMKVCKHYMPELKEFSATHQSRCWLNHDKAVKL
jgi:oligopeptide transport system ATP-binding protein